VSDAYRYITGEIPTYSKTLTWMDREMTTAATVPSQNINIVTTNFLMTADSIAEQTLERW
jgi:hypothetical protein